MMLSRKFKDSFDKVFKTFSNGHLPPADLQDAYKESFDGKLSKEKSINIRDNAVKYFTAAINDEFKKLCDEYEVEDKLLERQTIVNEQKNKPSDSGWRPSGYAESDTFGDRRQTQLNYIRILKDFESELEEQLKLILAL
uniref:Uncharacterized protein n=1 Tax=Panagrolaimus sp. ES5 TaxID=591445 RepID=A0AC34GWA4_9BILA